MEWVELLFTYDEIEAEIVQELLGAENIEVELRSQRMSAFPASVSGMGEIRLMVKAGELDRAREILRIIRESG